jgi:hypothetical protein
MPGGISAEDEQDDEADDQADNRAPLQQSRESLIVADVNGDVLCRRVRKQRFFVVSHQSPLVETSFGRSITTPGALPKS